MSRLIRLDQLQTAQACFASRCGLDEKAAAGLGLGKDGKGK